MKRHELSRRAFTVMGGAAALSVAELGLGVGCSDDVGTGGKRVELSTIAKPGPLSFVNAYGFRFEIERALLSIGPLRYLEGAPVSRSWIRRAFSIREAHAHPGHYVEGGTLGEMLVPTTVDLAAGPAELGSGPGVTGTARSARFSFQDPAQGELAEELLSHVVLVEASASSEQASLRVRFTASIGDVVDAEGQPFVAGCVLEGGAITDNGTIELTVLPSLWLDQVDLTELAGSGDEPIDVVAGTVAHRAFVRGLKKAGVYGFTYIPGSRP
jgi:hypothetical protein